MIFFLIAHPELEHLHQSYRTYRRSLNFTHINGFTEELGDEFPLPFGAGVFGFMHIEGDNFEFFPQRIQFLGHQPGRGFDMSHFIEFAEERERREADLRRRKIIRKFIKIFLIVSFLFELIFFLDYFFLHLT